MRKSVKTTGSIKFEEWKQTNDSTDWGIWAEWRNRFKWDQRGIKGVLIIETSRLWRFLSCWAMNHQLLTAILRPKSCLCWNKKKKKMIEMCECPETQEGFTRNQWDCSLQGCVEMGWEDGKEMKHLLNVLFIYSLTFEHVNVFLIKKLNQQN